MRPNTERKHRFLALDGLRGVAAFAVVLYHFRWPNHLTGPFQNGYLAVDLFFILSGFVIYANYSALPDLRSASHFIWLRFFRVYPLHLAVLAAFVALNMAKLWAAHFGVISTQAPFSGSTSVHGLIANLLLIHGLHVFHHLTYNFPSWTISCEFATYVLFGFAALGGLFRYKHVFLIGIMLAIVGYAIFAFMLGTLDVTYDWGILRCALGFFFGMCVFELTKQARGRQRSFSKILFSGFELSLCVAIVLVLLFAAGGFVFCVIPLFVAMVCVLQFDVGIVSRFLTSGPMQFLGRISYSIYMLHFFIFVCFAIAMDRILKMPISIDSHTGASYSTIPNPIFGDALLVLSVAVIVIVSAITYRLIEAPSRSFGRQLALKMHFLKALDRTVPASN